MKIKDKKDKLNISMVADGNTTGGDADVAVTLYLLSPLLLNTLPPLPLALTIHVIVISIPSTSLRG